MQIISFRDPNLVTSYLYLSTLYYIYEEQFTFHLQYKHSGTFANRKYEELSYPQNQKMYDPIPVTLFKMRTHYSQSSHKNATPSSGTSPLASYEEIPSPPGCAYSSDLTSDKLWLFLAIVENSVLPRLRLANKKRLETGYNRVD